MSAKEDLQRKIESLNGQLAAATASLNKILCDEYRFQPGDTVMHRGAVLTISSIGIKWGEPRAWGKKTLKNGELGNQEFELYGNPTLISRSATQANSHSFSHTSEEKR